MSDLRLTLNGRVLDRRAFLCTLSLTATAAGALFSGAARLSLEGRGEPGTWHVDDMWGHWPRYAHPIPYTVVRHVPIGSDTVAPVDRMFVA